MLSIGTIVYSHEFDKQYVIVQQYAVENKYRLHCRHESRNFVLYGETVKQFKVVFDPDSLDAEPVPEDEEENIKAVRKEAKNEAVRQAIIAELNLVSIEDHEVRRIKNGLLAPERVQITITGRPTI